MFIPLNFIASGFFARRWDQINDEVAVAVAVRVTMFHSTVRAAISSCERRAGLPVAKNENCNRCEAVSAAIIMAVDVRQSLTTRLFPAPYG